jgi:hypothetical protein
MKNAPPFRRHYRNRNNKYAHEVPNAGQKGLHTHGEDPHRGWGPIAPIPNVDGKRQPNQ